MAGPVGGDRLHDPALDSEITMIGDLVVAASESEGPLQVEEIDRVLGVEHVEEHADERAHAPRTAADRA